jgi:hypothetical protein
VAPDAQPDYDGVEEVLVIGDKSSPWYVEIMDLGQAVGPALFAANARATINLGR